LATDRGNVGASEDRLSFTGNALATLSNNLTAANSQITDVDVATESTNYAKYQILVQSGTAMLAQANQNPQSILKLLQ
jgi:flagellin